MSKVTKAEQAKAIEYLREYLKPGDDVYALVVRVSPSGMSRVLRLFVAGIQPPDNKPFIHDISYLVAQACGYTRPKDGEGFRIDGCGMDMGFAAVYDLGRTLFPNGFECLGSRCPGNDHLNGDREYTPHHHDDGGYALVRRWL